MKKDMQKTMFLDIVFLTLVFFLTTSTGCGAQEWSQKDYTKRFFIFQHTDVNENEYIIPSANVNIDDIFSERLGVAYNFNECLNLNMDLRFDSTDIEVYSIFYPFLYPISLPPAASDSDLFAMDLNIDFNVWKSPFIPRLTVGVGFFSFDRDWHYCDSDFSETGFLYNYGGGFRWDISDQLLIKAVYSFNERDLEYTNKKSSPDLIGVNIAYLF